jgi:16S rRNA (cytosine967-C5)-methyltransferase
MNKTHKRPAPDPARVLVFELLRQVNEEGAYANLRLPELLRDSKLDERDRAFATELGYGTLRMQGKHDQFIREFSSRPFEELDSALLNILRMGLHQLHEMRVADHAAVGETVEVARACIGEGKATFVNALLRESTRQVNFYDRFELNSEDDPAVKRTKLSVLTSHPEWEIAAFYDQLRDWDEVGQLLYANNVPAKPHLIAWPGRSEVEELISVGGTKLPWVRYGVLSEKTPSEYSAIHERRAGVQDLGSQLVCEVFLKTAGADDASLSWLDMCAGPGGKASALYTELHSNRASDTFLANEPVPHRAKLVSQVIPGDLVSVSSGQEFAEGAQRFDRILIDAPCTGLGALRRRPESRWRRTPQDLKELLLIQKELLNAGAKALNDGGIIAYVTCSPHILETKAQVVEFLRKNPDFEQINVKDFTPSDLPAHVVTEDGSLQLWTHRDGTDSMFMALLRKRA